MTTLVPRPPYSSQEIEQLYRPQDLELRQVQVILRHGERTPVTPRFQNAGLPAYWSYCSAAKQLRTTVMATKDWSKWDAVGFARQIETQGDNDIPVLTRGPKGETQGICIPGELTDTGRQTTLELGQRLRHLYVNQLGFMPPVLASMSPLYLRATPIPRALESVQQAFYGFYPPQHRAANLPPPTFILRAQTDETLYPNETICRRFAELARAFAKRSAKRWNDSPEMDYINKKIGKWMPEDSPRIGVDSHPRLSGIMDTINSTLAHGPDTRLPMEFYDPKLLQNIDKICVDEWFAGYGESKEYRTLGAGGLVADVTTRMVLHAESTQQTSEKDSPKAPTLGLSGAHDTTLASFLAALGAYNKEPWPPYTSHIAIELFRAKTFQPRNPKATAASRPSSARSWWSSIPLLSSLASDFTPPSMKATSDATPTTIARVPSAQLTADDKSLLQEHYVRIRYNDRPVTVPGCKLPGKHLPGDESFCTLAAFKEIVDGFTPTDWRNQCRLNLGTSPFPEVVQPAGVVSSS